MTMPIIYVNEKPSDAAKLYPMLRSETLWSVAILVAVCAAMIGLVVVLANVFQTNVLNAF